MEKKTTLISKENNFDFLRLLFASLVIVSHSYPLTGIDEKEILMMISNRQIDFGSLSVNCFFIISGYLILMSLQRSKNLGDYLWKRILRLFPALIVLLILTLMFLPFIYQGGKESIFEERTYWTYFVRNLSLYNLQFGVGGIFESNPFRGMINGSLWTLCYEFSMYLLLLPLFFVNNQRKLLIIIMMVLLISYVLYLFFPNFYGKYFMILKMRSLDFYRLVTYFFSGCLMVFVPQKILIQRVVLLGCLIILLSALYYGGFKFIAPILLPIVIIGYGISCTKYIGNLGQKIGDWSYGIYIYGFIVQQSLMYFFELNVWSLSVISLIISMFLAYFSWHYVENKSLQCKNLFS